MWRSFRGCREAALKRTKEVAKKARKDRLLSVKDWLKGERSVGGGDCSVVWSANSEDEKGWAWPVLALVLVQVLVQALARKVVQLPAREEKLDWAVAHALEVAENFEDVSTVASTSALTSKRMQA